MNDKSIISGPESRKILENQIRRKAMERRAEELAQASELRKKEILAEIEAEVEKEMPDSKSWFRVFGIN